MKQRISILLTLSLFLLLPACEKDAVQINGLAPQLQTGEDGALDGFVAGPGRGNRWASCSMRGQLHRL